MSHRRFVPTAWRMLLAWALVLPALLAPAIPEAVFAQVAPSPHRLAYVYSTDLAAANDFSQFLQTRGIVVDLVSVNATSFNFSADHLILVGADTGTLGTWGNATALQAIIGSERPVVGLGEGGYAFFGTGGLNLPIGFGNGAHGTDTQVQAFDTSLSMYTTPNAIPLPPTGSNVLTLYNTGVDDVGIFVQSQPAPGVTRIANNVGDATHFPLISDGNRLLWGFGGNIESGGSGAPSNMSPVGQNLFLNALEFVAPGTNPTLVTITGNAVCNGVTVQGTAELLSGSTVVQTVGIVDGRYTFTNVAPNTTFTVLLNPGGPVTCSVTVSTGAAGTTVAPNPAANPDRNNHRWDFATTLTVDSETGQLRDPNTGATISDFLFESGQSDWFKFSIAPQDVVNLTLTGAPGDYQIELFTDLQQIATSLCGSPVSTPLPSTLTCTPGPTAQQINNETSAVQGAPLDSSPLDSSPLDSSPLDSSPLDSSPLDSSPLDSSPLDSSPLDSSGAAVYVSSQQVGLLAVGKLNQVITRQTWDNTGNFYIRVFGTNGAFDPGHAFTATGSRAGGACANATLTFTPPSFSGGAPTATQTLILTNTSVDTQTQQPRIGGLLDTASFVSQLQSFAGRPDVNGVVVDLAADSGIMQDFARWDAAKSCAPASNIVSSAIHDLIAAYRAAGPSSFRYVVLAGGYPAIPDRLIPDESVLFQENNYLPPVLDSSATQSALRMDYIRSQDFYASFNPVSHFDHNLYIPDPNVGIGRLVETKDDIVGMLNSYIAVNGVVQPGTTTPAQTLCTGYQFMTPLALDCASQFSTGTGVAADQSLIQPQAEDQNAPDAWTIDQLKSKLFGTTKYSVIELNTHFSANAALPANYRSLLYSTDVDSVSDGRYNNVLVLSAGCHEGYNIPDPDAIAGVTQPRDWAQVWAGQHAVTIGSTGYGYGDTTFIGYTNAILQNVHSELRYGSGAVPIGVALTNAKRSYITGPGSSLSGVEEKATAELELFGLPMWSMNLPTGRIARPTPPTAPGPGAADQFGVLRSDVLATSDAVSHFSLARHDASEKFIGGDGATTASYFDADGDTYIHPDFPILPRKQLNLSLPSGATARGVALIAADYTDTPNFRPFISAPETDLSGPAPIYTTGVFSPIRVGTLSQIVNQSLVVYPFQFLSSSPGNPVGTARTFSPSANTTQPMFRVYYSNHSDLASILAGPPAVSNVTVTQTGPTLVHVSVTVGGLVSLDLEDLLLTFTAIPGSNTLYNHWTSCSMVPGRMTGGGTTGSCLSATLLKSAVDAANTSFVRTYTADLDTSATGASPTDVRLMIQAVSGTGLVTLASNNGAYYQVPPSDPTAALPKLPTTLTLQSPPTYGNYKDSISVSAVLSIPGCPGAGSQFCDRPVSFSVGSQHATATTNDSGVATAKLSLLALPAAYELGANFAETSDLLGSSAPPTAFTIKKQPTQLSLSSNGSIATLLDAAGRPLLQQTVFFVFRDSSTGNVVVTAAGSTDGQGNAQLPAVQFPPTGSFTVQACFDACNATLPLTVPLPGGGSTSFTDPRYLPSFAGPIAFTRDTTPPSCVISGIGTNSIGRYIQLTIQDTGSGLATITPTLNNAQITSMTSFSPGSTSPVVIVVNRINQSQPASIVMKATDVANNTTSCDPVWTIVGRDGPDGAPRSVTIRHLSSGSTQIVVYNDDPGVTNLGIRIDNKEISVSNLKPGEVRTIDATKYMTRGSSNVISITARGNPGGTAVVMIDN